MSVLVLFIVLFSLMALRVPIYLAMGLASLVYFAQAHMSLVMLAQRAALVLDSFPLVGGEPIGRQRCGLGIVAPHV